MEQLVNGVLRLEAALPAYRYTPLREDFLVHLWSWGVLGRSPLRCGWGWGYHLRFVSYLASPYRKPLARFISRFPAEAIGFFLTQQRLLSPEYSSLLQCMLKDREAMPMRMRFMSEPGTSAIIQLLTPKVRTAFDSARVHVCVWLLC